jgi:septal ring factor EnvC (AmiA/AmiB activator)
MKLIKCYLILLLIVNITEAQTTEKIRSKNEQLDDIRSDIEQLEEKISDKSSKEKQTVKNLNNIKQQELLLQKLLLKLEDEEQTVAKNISNTQERIKSLEKEMTELREFYRDYVVWIYKNGSFSKLKYLLNSESLNQAVTRYKYLQAVTDKSQEVLNKLESNKEELDKLLVELKNQKQRKHRLAEEKKSELAKLEAREEDKKKLLANLRQDKTALKNEIEEKRKAESQIKNLIAKLIEEERQRLESASKSSESEKIELDFNYENFTNFESLKGRLNWPVASGRITREFGENRNRSLNTITLNYGVDISTSKNANVHAVAGGYVSAINWIPSYGSVIIISHKNSFKTVYGHVTDIMVQEGDKIESGKVLGKVDGSLEGNIIHFEIWKERDNQNPEKWLVRR